jgi:hypothetical protein
MHPEHPQHCVAFDRGYIVGATSPLAIDSVARVALTSRLILPTQIPEVLQRVLAAPKHRDEVDVVAELAKLSPERTIGLRQRLVTQRAARTFSLDCEYVIEEHISITRHATCQIDVHAVVYSGALANLAPERLARDLRQLGSRFKLRPLSLRDLTRFEFPEIMQPLLETLRSSTSLPELEVKHRELDPRLVHSAVYALLACELCIVEREPQPDVFPRGTTASVPLIRDPAAPRVETNEASKPIARVSLAATELLPRAPKGTTEPRTVKGTTDPRTVTRSTPVEGIPVPTTKSEPSEPIIPPARPGSITPKKPGP